MLVSAMLAFNAQTLTMPSAKAHLAAPLPSRHPLPVATSPHLVPSQPLPVALCPAPHPPRLPLRLPPQFGAAAPGAMSVGGNAASMAAAAQKLAASMSGVTGAKAPEPTRAHYEAELEINDFPQHARWKVRGVGAWVVCGNAVWRFTRWKVQGVRAFSCFWQSRPQHVHVFAK